MSFGLPSVNVPVLSKATVRTSESRCSASPLRKKTPSSAPRPVPTMIDIGVASPIAQGQAIISTETAATIAVAIPAPKASHASSVSTDSPMTTGTNHMVTRSTSACIGSFAACASSTVRTIPASTVSAPTFSARISSAPAPFTVPAISASPSDLRSGSGSPVSMLSSTWLSPRATDPSTGTRAPGRKRSISPTMTSPMSASTKPSPRFTSTRVGASSTSLAIASPARPLARASK